MSETKRPRRRNNRRQISNMQFLFVVILAVGLLLAVNLSGRIEEGRRIAADRERLLQEIEALEATQAALGEELRWVQDPAFVSAWAHREGKMVRPGEVLVVPVPAGPPPAPTPTSRPQAYEETENWKTWWELFFDSPPPKLP